MTTRFNAIDEINNGVTGIKSGYDSDLKSSLSIPSCGIEDVDVAIFKLFENEIQPLIGGIDSSELKKVPILFAAGEKWALLKRGKPVRDKTNTLILPLVTIMRTSITQDMSDIISRGINQQTGELFVRRRLEQSDRNYQNLLNKFFIINQQNAFVNPGNTVSSVQSTSIRKVGDLKNDLPARTGGLLTTNRRNNIYETIVVPSPQFYTTIYTITIWTQFTQHMNQIIEKFMSSFLPQAQSWKVITPKGYWFVASVDSGAFNIETNFDDMSTTERFIKCTFNVKIPVYLWASSTPGIPIPIKRYISSPVIEFSLARSEDPKSNSDSTQEEFTNNFLLGNDDPTLPLDEKPNKRPDQRRTGSTLTPARGAVQTANPEATFAVPYLNYQRKPKTNNSTNSTNISDVGAVTTVDPAMTTAKRGVTVPKYTKIISPNFPITSNANIQKLEMGNTLNYVKIVSTNASTGETVYSSVNNNMDFEVIVVKSI